MVLSSSMLSFGDGVDSCDNLVRIGAGVEKLTIVLTVSITITIIINTIMAIVCFLLSKVKPKCAA